MAKWIKEWNRELGLSLRIFFQAGKSLQNPADDFFPQTHYKRAVSISLREPQDFIISEDVSILCESTTT